MANREPSADPGRREPGVQRRPAPCSCARGPRRQHSATRRRKVWCRAAPALRAHPEQASSSTGSVPGGAQRRTTPAGERQPEQPENTGSPPSRCLHEPRTSVPIAREQAGTKHRIRRARRSRVRRIRPRRRRLTARSQDDPSQSRGSGNRRSPARARRQAHIAVQIRTAPKRASAGTSPHDAERRGVRSAAPIACSTRARASRCSRRRAAGRRDREIATREEARAYGWNGRPAGRGTSAAA